MAKKSVATFSGEKGAKRTYVKCIKMRKSDRTGAYIFKERLIPLDREKAFFEDK